MQAQFILEAPKTSVENGVISNYKWYVQDGMEENGGDAVWLPSSQDGDHLLEVKIPGVYYATYDGNDGTDSQTFELVGVGEFELLESN